MKSPVEGAELVARCMDASFFGLGLLVTEHNRSFLKNNRILWLTKLQDQELSDPIFAEVVYISNEVDSRYHNLKARAMKVGLKLSGVLPEELYGGFIL